MGHKSHGSQNYDPLIVSTAAILELHARNDDDDDDAQKTEPCEFTSFYQNYCNDEVTALVADEVEAVLTGATCRQIDIACS